MYKIIGADGREYGPVTAEQLRQWIREGRANADTRVQAEHSVEWKPLGGLPEFADALPKAPTTPPPLVPPPVSATTGGTETNGMAVAGLILSVLGFFQCCGPIFSTLGLIFSVVALSQIDRNPRQQSSRSLAIAGIVIAILGYVVFGIIMTMGLMRGFVCRFRV
ncbi:MAG: DUF4190 domain-containing protein [Candidatus Omnitrophica bacterium]|nr:DUF4190 domain-containing protein [Candidatus Omnitrophota bacterium]